MTDTFLAAVDQLVEAARKGRLYARGKLNGELQYRRVPAKAWRKGNLSLDLMTLYDGKDTWYDITFDNADVRRLWPKDVPLVDKDEP